MNFNIDASASEMRTKLRQAKEIQVRRTQGLGAHSQIALGRRAWVL